MTKPTTDERLAELREQVANDMADAVVPGLIARLDAAEQTAQFLLERAALFEEKFDTARRDALLEAADEARRRGDAAARIRHGTPTDGWLHDFANWLESRMAEENASEGEK